MYAIAYFFIVLQIGGPLMGQRDPDAADRWTMGRTQAECEAKILADWRAFADRNGDKIIHADIKCEPVGA